MLKWRKLALVMVCFLMLSFLGACGVSKDQNEETGEETAGNASGIMLAGQEAPEIVGILKSIEANDEVMITVEGQDVQYRLSEEAKSQIDKKEVELDSEVTFTTFSIGDDKETVAEFIIE
ncbi:hypothetical protein [Bacillus sp. MRMR6]|uniref:hypothetical protein n=1 Tax=Bacillus sp. MRMR6 TaxID=1928617 RepID=UPI0009531CB0|nr:hypothetical protein [Bacillus sp. MRMR6]OLS39201.1 hypothetical protein BTR25_12355 [Bacillus sp. MRMR6]